MGKKLGRLLETNGKYWIVFILLKQLFSRCQRAREYKITTLFHSGVCLPYLESQEGLRDAQPTLRVFLRPSCLPPWNRLSCRLVCWTGARGEQGATLRRLTSMAETQDMDMRPPMSAWEMGERHPAKVCLPCLCTPQQACSWQALPWACPDMKVKAYALRVSEGWRGKSDLSVNFEGFAKGKTEEKVLLRSTAPLPGYEGPVSAPGAGITPPPAPSACAISRQPICNPLVSLGLH